MATRFSLPVLVLVALALVPTILHTYLGLIDDDGRRVGAIEPRLVGLKSIPTKRASEWVREIFASDDWIEREYLRADGTKVLLFAARSHDLKRLYHHPELGILYGIDLRREGTVSVPNQPEVLAHVLRNRTGKGLAAYALLYDGTFVESPLKVQLRSAWESLLNGRKAMTLFLVYDENLAREMPFRLSTAEQLLADAVRSFLGQPGVSEFVGKNAL